LGFFEALLDDLEGVYKGHYEAGVEQAAGDVPVVYIDPKQFQTSAGDIWKIHPENEQSASTSPEERERIENSLKTDAANLKSQFASQENFPAEELENLNEEVFTKFVAQSKLRGPFAMKIDNEGQALCVVNKPDSNFDEKHEIASAISRIDADKLGNIPGGDHLHLRYLGIHEGVHCSQELYDRSSLSSIGISIKTLEREAQADKAASNYLEQRGEHETSQFMKDMRALGTSHDPKHATSAIVDNHHDHTKLEANAADYFAAVTTETSMILGVGESLNLNYDNTLLLREQNPEAFLNEVDRLVEKGEFDHDPALKEYIQDYSDAYRRQIIEPAQQEAPSNPLIDPNHAALDEIDESGPQIAAGEISDEMQIGGVSASAYFNSYADPLQAEQRLALNNEQTETPALQEQKISTAPASPGLA
jgi:hypothetical protein